MKTLPVVHCGTRLNSISSCKQKTIFKADKASVFVKAKKILGNYEDTSLVNYGIYCGRKKFYDTGPDGMM